MNVRDACSLINPGIRGLTPYHLNPEEVAVKLNQNENPFDWPPEVKDDVAAFCRKRPWNRYPPFVPSDLKRALADHVGVSPENVIAGNGSNEMLLILLLALTSARRPLITCQPVFTVYRLLAAGLGCDEEPVFLTPQLRFDVDAVCEALRRRRGAVLVLCSPNNPTGGALTEQQLRAVLDVHEGFLICDQAYVEFGGCDALPLLKEYPNLLITRTFSKAFAAAGLRLGYMIGAGEVIAELNKIKLPYNINFFSSHAATVLLAHTDIVRRRVAHIVKERDRLQRFLASLPPVTAFESEANFILIRVADKDALVHYLASRDILVRDVSGYPMLENCLRISIGTTEENDMLMDGLSSHYGAPS